MTKLNLDLSLIDRLVMNLSRFQHPTAFINHPIAKLNGNPEQYKSFQLAYNRNGKSIIEPAYSLLIPNFVILAYAALNDIELEESVAGLFVEHIKEFGDQIPSYNIIYSFDNDLRKFCGKKLDILIFAPPTKIKDMVHFFYLARHKIYNREAKK